jgi:hypothetical protein
VLSLGDRKKFLRCVSELASLKNEIVGVVPEKAEGTPVPGAGFSPESVPGNEVEGRKSMNQSAQLFEALGKQSRGHDPEVASGHEAWNMSLKQRRTITKEQDEIQIRSLFRRLAMVSILQ